MGISTVTNKSSDKTLNKQSAIDRDLKACMKCKYFWGNNHQCSLKRCYKEKKKPAVSQNIVKRSECDGCTYRQSERYCFPCMKKLLEKK